MTDHHEAPADPVGASSMTAAEFRVVREYLGLTGDWLAAALGVTSRTVRSWEQGKYAVPDGVRVELERMEHVAAQHVTAAVESYEDMRDPTDIPLITYRTDDDYRAHHPDQSWPASWHRAVCARVAQEVPGLTIEYWTRTPSE